MNASLSNESMALLKCFKQDSEPDEVRAVLSSPLEWDQLITSAARLSLTPFLYVRLNQQNVLNVVPRIARDSWRWGFFTLQSENRKKFVQVQQVLRALYCQNIPVIVLKGAALAELVYPSLGCRPMGDVDLLVRKSDLQKAEEILKSLGLQANERAHSKQWYRECHHHLAPYESQDGSFIVELHHHVIPLSDPVQIPIDELWDRSVSATVASVPCRVLAPDDMLIHLCYHLSANNAFLGQLRGLCDIAQTIGCYNKNIDWSRLCDNAIRFGLQKHVYYSLWLSKTCVGADARSAVVQRLVKAHPIIGINDRLFKFLIRRAIFIYDANRHPFYLWGLRDTCIEWLSQRGSFDTCRAIFHRLGQRFKTFALRYSTSVSQQDSRSFVLCYVRYLAYLSKKAFGLMSGSSR